MPYPRLLSDVSTGDPDAGIEILEVYARLQSVMERCLQPLEVKVLLLHYGHGLPLAAITESLNLSNASGAKAYIVNSRRKLRKALEGKTPLAYARTELGAREVEDLIGRLEHGVVS